MHAQAQARIPAAAVIGVDEAGSKVARPPRCRVRLQASLPAAGGPARACQAGV
jgi:hypothetical protein